MTQYSVLIIDDDPDVRRSLGAYFEQQHYEVYQAASGGEGIATWDRVEPDVTLVDLHMSGMDGMQVLEVLRGRRAVVIMLTGHGDIEIAVRAMQMGAENFLTKPIDMSHLSAVVEKAADKCSLRRENVTLRARLTPSLKRRMARLLLIGVLLVAAAGIGALIGGGQEEARPREPIPVPLDTTP